jgi:Zn-dependent M32 family carboxypeptidase
MKTANKTPLYTTYQQYVPHMQKKADICFSNGALQWDQETYLPPNGADARGRQISTLETISHELFSKTHQWLKNQVFIHGKFFNSLELCNISTGKPFKTSEFIWHLENKFRIHYQTQPTQG